jgi:hypothetical protein
LNLDVRTTVQKKRGLFLFMFSGREEKKDTRKDRKR